MKNKSLLRSTLLIGALAAIGATAAVAGNGVGGIFNLGVVNTVNGRTDLQGTTSTQSLRVVNSHTSTVSAAIAGVANRGTGVLGSSTSRMGVRALATNTSGVNYGIYATTASRGGLAGYFQNTGTTTDPTLGRGIRALAAGAPPSLIDNLGMSAGGGEFAGPHGVIGISSVSNGAGVRGLAGEGYYGVYGSGFYGVYGSGEVGLQGSGTQYGVYAISSGTGVYADGTNYGVYSDGNAHVVGNLTVTGSVSKGSGSFKIDHPLDPANKYLSHSFVESPDMMNIYNGNVVTDAHGEAVVALPDYFEALNRDPRYQLTVIGSPATAYVSEKVSDNRFAIKTSEPGVEVSWQVTGIRQDAFAEAHPIVVEEDKALADRGRYLHPEEHGHPADLAIGELPEQTQAASASVKQTLQ